MKTTINREDKQPLRVAILGTRGIPAQYGGFETFAERLSLGLVAQGIGVTVYCESDEPRADESYHGVHLRYISMHIKGALRTIIFDLRSLWDARKGFDVVYMLGYGAAQFCFLPRLWGAEVWINVDGLEWARSKWNVVARWYFHIMEFLSPFVANRIIADAEAIRLSLIARHRLPCCSVIPYGCEVIEKPPSDEPLRMWGVLSGEYYLVVCRLEPENHVREIIEGFCLSKSHKTLLIVGNHLADSAYAGQLRAIHDERVHLIGTVYDQIALGSLRYHCSGYLHGHSVGGTNPSLLESMGCANVVLAHDNPFNREVLADCGLFFKSSKELAKLINQVETGLVDIARLRQRSQERVKANYRWSQIIAAYIELLRER